MKKTTFFLAAFLSVTTSLPICHAGIATNCRQVGDQTYCDTEDVGHGGGLLHRWMRSSSEKKQREHEEKMTKMSLAAHEETIKKQNALLEEQRKNLELERKIKEEQLKQLQLQNAQAEMRKK